MTPNSHRVSICLLHCLNGALTSPARFSVCARRIYIGDGRKTAQSNMKQICFDVHVMMFFVPLIFDVIFNGFPHSRAFFAFSHHRDGDTERERGRERDESTNTNGKAQFHSINDDNKLSLFISLSLTLFLSVIAFLSRCFAVFRVSCLYLSNNFFLFCLNGRKFWILCCRWCFFFCCSCTSWFNVAMWRGLLQRILEYGWCFYLHSRNGE